tara:strand:+ start:119 stop:235 length:117 start_codon:yes stop_codon:yes gene_type:complete
MEIYQLFQAIYAGALIMLVWMTLDIAWDALTGGDDEKH